MWNVRDERVKEHAEMEMYKRTESSTVPGSWPNFQNEVKFLCKL